MISKMSHSVLVVLLFLLGCSELCKGQSLLYKPTKIVDRLLSSSYDKRIRPFNGNETYKNNPVIVRVSMLVRDIESLDDATDKWTVQLTFRQQWTDERLKFSNSSTGEKINYINLLEEDAAKIWKPDTFFKNEKEGHFHNLLTQNTLVRVHSDGSVLYSVRVSLVLACPMDLVYYPRDSQMCTIDLASYGFTADDIMFTWKEHRPVQVSTDISLSRFTLTKYTYDDCTGRTNTGTYSCLKAIFVFKREFSSYLLQMYIPCMMLVLVSWIGFWMNVNKALTARSITVLGSLFTLTGLVAFLNSSMPPTNYSKQIDQFTGVSLGFVIAALLEMATVNYLANSCCQEEKNDNCESSQFNKMALAVKKMNFCHKLDVFSRIAFPVAYLLLVIFYV